MKKILSGMAVLVLLGAINSANAQDTNAFEKSLQEQCGACFSVATHVQSLSSSQTLRSVVSDSTAYVYRLALLSMSQPMYDALAEQDVLNGRLLTPEEAKTYISSEAGSRNVQLRVTEANEID